MNSDLPEDFRALSHRMDKVGRHIKASKCKYQWRFQLEGQDHSVDFYVSRFSRKKKLILDGNIVSEIKGGGPGTSYPFLIGQHSFFVYQLTRSSFDLRFEHHSFQSFMYRDKNPPAAPSGNTRDPFQYVDPFAANVSVGEDDFREEDYDYSPPPRSAVSKSFVDRSPFSSPWNQPYNH